MSEPSIARGMRPNRYPLDEDSASRLLQGIVHPDDAPPGYGSVAGLLNSAAQLPLGPVDEDAAAITVSAMVEVIRDVTPAPETSRRKTMLGKLLAGKALAAVAVVGLTATGAAAATGTLPDPAQSVVSDAVSHVGIDIPHPKHGKSAAHRKDGDHRKDGKDKPSGDDEAPGGDDNSSEEPKGMSGVVDGLKATRTDESGPLGQEVCQIASDNKCHSGSANPGQGGGDDNTTPPAPKGENPGRGDENNGDHGKPEATPPAASDTPKGSIATGEENSERDLPSGKNKPE
jgi:hypothetical protein